MSPIRRLAAWGAVTLSLCCAAVAQAQVPELLGRLEVALEPEVAAELNLSDGAKSNLTKLRDQREDAGLNVALEAQSLPKAERDAKIAAFRAQSEGLAKRVLSTDQWNALGRIVIRREGLLSLREADVATGVTLTPEQQATRDKLLADLDAKSGTLDAAGRRALEIETERGLRNLLTPEQFAAWQALAGETPGSEHPGLAPAPTATAGTPAAGTPAAATTPAAPAGTTPADPAMAAPNAASATAGAPAAVPGAPATTAAAPPAGTPLTPSLPGPGSVPGIGPGATATGARPAAPASRTTTTSTAPKGPDGEYQLKFSFRYQPWGDVLDWFAKQADLSLVMDAAPPGTFNYSDSRTYSPAQAIDLLNSVLLTKGYTLLRRERMLLVVNLEDGVPPNLVTYVPQEKLNALGEYELVKTLFPLGTMTAAEAEGEIRPMLGPQGAIAVLAKSKQIVVTETAGRLRAIRDILSAATNAPGNASLVVIQVKNTDVGSVVDQMRQLMDIPADKNAAADGSLRFSPDSFANKLIITGSPEKVARAKEIIEAVDVPLPGSENGAANPAAVETPQLEVYGVGDADPASTLAVLQTMMVGQPDVRLAIDPKTNSIVALARPSEHSTIRATLAQLQRDSKQTEVFRLRKLDPTLAVLSINKLFGGESAGASAPKVEADKTLNQILARGTQAQIAQIRDLLSQMGESQYGAANDTPATADSERGNVRLVPLTGRAGRTALEQLQQLWPTMRPNRIRIVSQDEAPAEVGRLPGVNPTGATPNPAGATVPLDLLRGMGPRIHESPTRPAPKPAPAPSQDDSTTAVESDERTVPAARMMLSTLRYEQVAQAAPAAGEENAAPAAPAPKVPAKPAAPAKPGASGTPAEIVVIPGPGGLIISSEDPEALDEFESLLESLTSAQFTGGREFTVFYLKSAPAAVVQETLNTIFSISAPEGGGGSLLGDMANNAFGGMGGGIMGAMLGLDSGSGGSMPVSSGSLQIVADPRLNALIVQGPPKDLDAIEQLLKVLDQEDLPESLVASKPRILPIKYQPANDVLTTLKSVYADRLTAGSGGQQRQPSPEELIQMLRGGGGRGGRGGGGGAQQNRQAEAQKMSIGVDTRGNTLIVVAPQALYEEVEQLVATLDVPNESSSETTAVVPVRRTNPTSVQRAIQAVVGPSATTTSNPANTANSQNRNNQNRTGAQGAFPQNRGGAQGAFPFGGQGTNRGGFGGQGTNRGGFGGFGGGTGGFGGGTGGRGGSSRGGR